MTTANKQIRFLVTDAQRDSIYELQNQLDISLSQLLRDLVGMACVQRGIDWEDDIEQPGGDRWTDSYREEVLRKAEFLENVMDIDEAMHRDSNG